MQRFVQPGAGRFEVVIEDAAHLAMVDACKRAKSMETGGILIGRLTCDGKLAFVCEATEKPSDSSAGWSWFRRGSQGLKGLLAKRWELGMHYLGEWHFHPGGGCHPSRPDVAAMNDVASDERYACPEPLLIILGGRVPDAYQLSVSVFPQGETPIFLRARPSSSGKAS